MTTCTAKAVEQAISPSAFGVAVIYEVTAAGEKIFLVIESRAGSLLAQCLKRLQTAKLPALEALTISFLSDTLPDASPEAVQAACRQQVVFAGELRRELRPAMR